MNINWIRVLIPKTIKAKEMKTTKMKPLEEEKKCIDCMYSFRHLKCTYVIPFSTAQEREREKDRQLNQKDELLTEFMKYWESDFFRIIANDGRVLASWIMRVNDTIREYKQLKNQ